MGRSRSRSRSRSPHKSHKHKRDAYSPTSSRSTSKHKSHHRDHREKRSPHYSSERRHRSRSRSRSPKDERDNGTRRIGSSHKRHSQSSSQRHKSDYAGINEWRERDYKIEEKKDETSESELSEESLEMMRVMGFAKFHSTKGEEKSTEFLGRIDSEVRIVKKRRYRQYMNRRGGFNRPLDPIN